MSISPERSLTLDANVFVAALKADEPYSDDCLRILNQVPGNYTLVEPSIVYVEVLGTLARKVGSELAERAKVELDRMFNPLLVVACDRDFCLRSYTLCSEYGIYSIDSLYLNTAIEAESALVSLDKEDFVDKIRTKASRIKVLHVTEF